MQGCVIKLATKADVWRKMLLGHLERTSESSAQRITDRNIYPLAPAPAPLALIFRLSIFECWGRSCRCPSPRMLGKLEASQVEMKHTCKQES